MFWRTTVAVAVVAAGVTAALDPRRADRDGDAAPTVRVNAPLSPRPYPVPAGAVAVRSGAALARLLARERPLTMRLAPGRYEPPAGDDAFRAAAAHRIYARHRGRSVLAAGLVIGGNYARGGARVQGLAFDIADARRAPEASAIHIWGVSGRSTTILDTTFEGRGAVDAAIRADEVQGLTVRRVRIANFRRYGLYASDNDPRSSAAAREIGDVSVRGVKLPQPGSAYGRSEFGVWIGNRVRRPIERIRIRDFGWGGLWTGNRADDLRLRDLDVDGSARADGVAIYIEHTTRRSVFQRFDLGPDIKEGFVSEAAQDGEPTGGGIENVVSDGVIDTGTRLSDDRVGVNIGLRTVGMSVRGVRFLHADRACILDAGVGTRLADNDYEGRASGADVVERHR